MSNKNHIYLGEFSEGDAMYSLIQKARHLFQCQNRISYTYESFKQDLYGFSLKSFSFLRESKKESFVLRCQQWYHHNRNYRGESERNRLPSTPVKRNQNVSNLQRKHLRYDNTSNQVSQTVSKCLEKQSTSVKTIPHVTDPRNSPQKNTPLLAVVSDESPTFSKKRSKQSTSMKVNRNSTEFESLSSKHLPLVHKEPSNVEPVNLDLRISDMDRPILNLSTGECRKSINPIAKVYGRLSKAEKEKPENSSEGVQMSRMFTERAKVNQSSYKEVRVHGFPSTDDGKSTKVKATSSEQSPSMKVSRNVTESESLRTKHLPLGHKEIKTAEPLNLESNIPARLQKVADNPKKIDRVVLNLLTKIGKEYVNPIGTDQEAHGITESNKEQEKPDDTVKMSSMFTEKVTKNLSPYSEVRVDGVLNIDGGNDTSPLKATESNNQITFGLTGESTSKGKIEEFSSAKKSEISSSSASKYQESLCSDNKARRLEHSYQDNEKNITSNQAINIFRNCERKRKSPSPRKTAVKCSSKPKNIHLSGPAEIETGICIESTENPSLNASPVSLIEHKSVEMITDKEEFSGNKSKPGLSRDISPSTKDIMTCSTSVFANNRSVTEDVINLEKGRLHNKFLKTVPLNKYGSGTLSSPGIESEDTETLIYCITQFQNLVLLREKFLKHIYDAIASLQHELICLCDYVENIVYVLHEICTTAECVSEMLQNKVTRLIPSALELVKKLVALRIDVTLDTMYWAPNLQRISKIYSRYEPLVSNGKPLVTIQSLQAYEKDLKTVWDWLDMHIYRTEDKRLCLLTTERDIAWLINQFSECLIMMGLL